MSKIHIRAETPWHHIDFSELHAFRFVLWMFIVRDIKLRYKQTALGIAWVVLQPLLTALLFTVVFGALIRVPSDGLPYTLFAFCGLVPWIVFSQSLQRASDSLVNDTKLITKVYFPRIFVPLSATFGVGIDFLIALGILFCLMIGYGVTLSSNIWFLPIATLVLFGFSSGINFFFSSLNVYYRDFKHIVPFMVQLWMYASPLVYSGSMVPERFQLLYSINPMAGIIDGFRWCLLGTGPFPLFSFSVAAVFSALLFVSGTFVFRKIEHFFADII